MCYFLITSVVKVQKMAVIQILFLCLGYIEVKENLSPDSICFSFFFFYWHINFRGLFNSKSIFIEGE